MDAIFDFGGRESMYAYTHGMVSGLHGKLLRRQDYDLLIQAGSVQEVLSSLENTPYGGAIRKLRKDFTLQDVEEALASEFKRTYIEITSSIPGEDKAALDGLLLGGWDMRNLKTVVRALKAGFGGGSPGMFVVFGRLGRDELTGLAGLGDAGEIPGRVPEPYSTIMGNALRKGSQLEFEEDADRGFLLSILGEARGGVRDYIRLLVDILNLRTLMRCKAYGVDAGGHLINEGYHLKPRKLAELSRMDGDGFARALEGTPYHKAVSDTVSGARGCTLENLDARLQSVLTGEAEYQAILKPLGVASVIAYLRRREAEVAGLRAIVAGKWHKLGAEEIKAVLA